MFDSLRSLFRPAKRDRRDYLGAQLGRTQSFITQLQRADQEIRKDLGALRAHSRNLAKNTPYMRRYLRVIGAGVVGAKGITLQSKVRKRRGALVETTNASIESAWRAWGESPTVCGRYTWPAVQRQALRATALDGECFIRVLRGVGEMGMLLQFLDADLLDHNFNDGPAKGRGPIVMGVELDAWSRPVAYHFTDTTERGLPGTGSTVSAQTRQRIPADQIIHIYDPERANQTRGVPWAASVMYLLSMLSAYWEAEVAAARHEAERIAFIKEAVGPGVEPCDISPSAKAAEILSGPVTYLGLEPGQDIVTPEIQHPTTAFGEFSKAMLKGVASGLGVSYAALASDYTEVSFSSIRQGELEQRDHWREIQGLVIDKLCKRVFAAWIPYAVASGEVSVPSGLALRDLQSAQWVARGWDWVDPKKDAESAAILLGLRLTTRGRLLAAQGEDLEETLRQVADEEALAAELGVSLETEPPKQQKEDPDADAA